MEEIDWSKVKLPTVPQMKTAFETQEGTKNALTAVEISLENIQTTISDKKTHLSNLQKEIKSKKEEIRHWEFGTKGIATINAVIAIICAVVAVLLGIFWGIGCLVCVIPALICTVFVILRGKKASLKGYYNKERNETIAEDESKITKIKAEVEELEPIEDQIHSLVPAKYSSFEAMDYMMDMLDQNRAHNFAQAADEWDEEAHRRKMEEMQNAQLQSQLRAEASQRATERAAKAMVALEAANLFTNIAHRDD